MAIGGISMGGMRTLFDTIKDLKGAEKMPMLFVGHGSPMNAIEESPYSLKWRELGSSLPLPAAILSISAHWLTHGTTKVLTSSKPRTIHDFGGFPKRLFDMQYPAAGSPEFAGQTISLLQNHHVESDQGWGLDHGTWSVLCNMYPQSNIPVYQLSIDYSKPPEYHFNMIKGLQVLRSKGVLVMGSGNIVHNLSMLSTNGQVYNWSIEFDTLVKDLIEQGDFLSVVDFQKTGSIAKLAHPTHEHFLPLLYVLGLANGKDTTSYFNEGFDFGSISMRSLLVGSS